MIQGLLYYTWILSKNRESKEYKPITRRHRYDLEFMWVGSLASRPFASAFILGQGGGKVISRAVGTGYLISPRPRHRSCAAVTTSRFGEFAVCKDCMEHHSVVLQLFKIEATRLGLAGSTDLQTPVPQRDLSFVYLTFKKLEKLSKVRLNQRYQKTDNNDNTLWIIIFFENDFISLCRILLASSIDSIVNLW